MWSISTNRVSIHITPQTLQMYYRGLAIRINKRCKNGFSRLVNFHAFFNLIGGEWRAVESLFQRLSTNQIEKHVKTDETGFSLKNLFQLLNKWSCLRKLKLVARCGRKMLANGVGNVLKRHRQEGCQIC